MLLSEEEQVARYRNMLQEYHALKKGMAQKADEYYSLLATFHKKEQMNEMQLGAYSLKRARSAIQKEKYEIKDCEQLMENLASLLASKKMQGDSVEFGLIHALVSKVMRRKKGSKGGRHKHTPAIVDFFKSSRKEELVGFYQGAPLSEINEEVVSNFIEFRSNLSLTIIKIHFSSYL